MTPHLVKEVRRPAAAVVSADAPAGLAARDEAGDRRDAQHDDAGGRRPAAPARAAQIPGVKVAGKTGTAETGEPGVYDAWFIFFAPADDPVVAGAVVVEHQLNGFGGAVAAPIAKELMQAILPASVERSKPRTVWPRTDTLSTASSTAAT